VADVNLSKAVRSNLLSLQSTAASMAKTQERLATGLKVNSALDNPTNFFTAASLNSRAGDMSNLLDSMSNGIKTIEAADNGLSSITKTVESMQSTLRQARQDKSFKTSSYSIDLGSGLTGTETLSFSGGALTGTETVDVAAIDGPATQQPSQLSSAWGYAPATVVIDSSEAGTFQIQSSNLNGGSAVTVTLNDGDTISDIVDNINTALDGASGGDGGITASTRQVTSTVFAVGLSNPSGASMTITEGATGTAYAAGFAPIWGTMSSAPGQPAGTPFALSVDTVAASINSNAALQGKIRASNDAGKLKIENLSTEELTVRGVGSDGDIDGGSGTADIGGNEVRKNLVKQFNELRDQLDKLADDASFNGINLLRGDKLKLTFNESGTSTIDIQAKDSDGDPTSVNNTTLGITSAVFADFDSDASLDARLGKLGDALGKLRSQASAFGSNLSIVENRNDFTKSMINTLETGAANLTLADTNQEAANLLALQTRQQLSSTALSMASQADQAVLRLF
jgi:flagellin-like hook-associated protein FlgL